MHITFDTSYGRITMEEEDHMVSRLYFTHLYPNYSITEKPSLFLRQAAWEVQEYLEGRSRNLYVPVKADCPHFISTIWDGIRRIGYGKTATPLQITGGLKNPMPAAAVALACRRNPVPILIPTHRVVGVRNSMDDSGPDGAMLRRKLLAMEMALQNRN